MRIEMNIALGVAAGDNSDAAVMSRGCRAVSLLAESLYFGRVESRVDRVTYDNPNGERVTETTLITRAVVRAPLRDVFDMVEYLSERLEQDCIAVALVDENDAILTGELLGPRASAWGRFNPKFFVRFNPVAVATQKEAA